MARREVTAMPTYENAKYCQKCGTNRILTLVWVHDDNPARNRWYQLCPSCYSNLEFCEATGYWFKKS